MTMDEKDFRLVYDETRSTVAFSGVLRLSDPSRFGGVQKFLLEVYDLEGPALVLDFTALEFMNSAGISVLCKYIFTIKDLKPAKAVTVVGNGALLWQRKTFENLPKIWDQVSVRFTEVLPPAGSPRVPR